MTTTFTVATYNILHPSYERRFSTHTKFPEVWKDRGEKVKENIAASKYDILCLQEIGSKDPTVVYAKHKNKEDGVGIFFNPKRFTRIRQFICFGNNERATVSIDLQENDTKKVIRVASIHIRGPRNEGFGDKQLESALTMLQMETENVDAMILAGDLGELQPTLFISQQFSLDHSIKPTNLVSEKKTDHIAAKAMKQQSIRHDWTRTYDRVASDHLLVQSQISLLPKLQTSQVEADPPQKKWWRCLFPCL